MIDRLVYEGRYWAYGEGEYQTWFIYNRKPYNACQEFLWRICEIDSNQADRMWR